MTGGVCPVRGRPKLAVILTVMDRSGGLRVVAFGGGTGLPVLLQGLRDRIGDLVAVVTVADDGGSSGRLRQGVGGGAPGDVRKCLGAFFGGGRVGRLRHAREGRQDLLGQRRARRYASAAGGDRGCRERRRGSLELGEPVH